MAIQSAPGIHRSVTRVPPRLGQKRADETDVVIYRLASRHQAEAKRIKDIGAFRVLRFARSARQVRFYSEARQHIELRDFSFASPETQELVDQWIVKAEHDLTTARHTLTLKEECPFHTICFHSQQCAEKYLKALLIFHGG
jgi:HEPN domain